MTVIPESGIGFWMVTVPLGIIWWGFIVMVVIALVYYGFSGKVK